ncbi:MAG: molybdopterin oxidoreductase family protein [Blastocatellia bacterium]|nr:molybdopterin oxidoreductase family protein [Blastocatellia bacterium]
MSSNETKVIRAACPHDCPDTCAMLVTIENGKAIKVEGASDHPTTNGFLCTKVNRYLERTYSEQRVLYPMKRVGEKGKGLFTRISWEEALDTIAIRFKAVADEFGPQSILPYSYAGTMGLVQSQSMDRRFFHKLGASLLDRTICASAGAAGYKMTIGASIGTDLERFDEAKLIVIWGSNPQTSNVHLMPKILEARRRGAKLIAIDPYRSLTAEKCQQHIALLPGTDGALALAMMHVIINENLIDADYINQYTLGFNLLKERVQEYPPARVATITGLSEETITNFAREYATAKPAVIRLNYGMQRHAGGGMAVRTIACLPALIGAWRDPAGGVLLSSSGTFSLNSNALERPDFIPSGTRMINMSAIGDALLGEWRLPDNSITPLDPPVKAIYVYNSNPVAIAPDSGKVKAGFAREDLFTVVHEIFQTDTADYADIVLPATTQLEQFDVHKAYGHLYVLANNPAIAPLGEAKPNSEVFRLLAARMGFDDPCFTESDEEIGAQAFNYDHERMQTIDFARLKESGWQRLNVPERYAPFAQGNFPTPSGKCEFFSEALAQQGMDPLPTYIPPRESVQTAPLIARKYPLAIISPPAHNFLNSTFANLPSFLRAEKEPFLEIHPDDAGARGVHSGDRVKIFNDRGAFTARARVSDKARSGVIVALSVWWKKLTDGTNANDVTSQGLTDLGAAATFYDVLVEVEKLH